MIEKLLLHSFGKFHKQEFDLKKLSLFTGPNEAGKTTIFDSLQYALFEPKGNSSNAKYFRSRYGKAPQVEINTDGQNMDMSENDFLQLCSISPRYSGMDLRAANGWIGSIKAQLFTGGVNPDLVINQLEKRADTNKTLKHNRELESQYKLLEKQKSELESLQNTRSRSLNELHSASQTANELQEIQKELKQAEERLEQEQHINDQYSLLDARERMRDELQICQQFVELQKSIEHTVLPDTDAQNKIHEIAEGIEHNEREHYAKKQLITEQERSIRKQQNEQVELESRQIIAGKKAAEAQQLLDQLNSSTIQDVSRQKTGSTSRIAAIILCVIGGISFGSSLILSKVIADAFAPVIFTILSASGIAITVSGLFLFLLRTILSLFAKKADIKNQKVQDIARQAHLSLQIAESENLQKGLETIIQDNVNLQQRISMQQQLLEETKQRLRELENELDFLTNKTAQLQEQLQSLLDASRLSDLEELKSKQSELAQQKEHLAKLQNRIPAIMQHYEIQTLENLLSDLHRRLHHADEQIELALPDETEKRNARRRLDETKSNLQELRTKESQLQLHHQRMQTSYDVSFAELPQKIRRLEEAIQESEHTIRDLELTRRAAAEAAHIVREIKGGADQELQEISKQVGKWFAEAMDGERTIHFERLDSITAEDAGGTQREIDLLSTGTSESFYLAARLALIAESQLENGLVILDDPCISMDQERRKQAAGIIAKFLRDTSHQIIYLSKDEDIIEDIQEHVSKTSFIHHRLSRLT